MGYYIQTPGSNTGKADIIMKEHDAIEIGKPSRFDEIPQEFGLICVVSNGLFDAAAYAYSADEFEQFANERDIRPKRWLIMLKEKAEELSGFSVKK